ncbi:MAG: lycopene cyclase domain-containing protein [Acidimicrobiales bacterium]
MPEYTTASLASVVILVIAELAWLRTGVFKTGTYWIAYGIIVFFQIIVDGWLTKLTAPIVLYSREESSGLRYPWDVPVEDYAFGFTMCTLAIILWVRFGQRQAAQRPAERR